MNNYKETMKVWLDSPVVDAATKEAIGAMSETDQLAAFGGFMSFGTAGLRAKMSPGTARMNTYTVAHATNALAKTIVALGTEAMERGVAIAYDSRNNSIEFARRSAEVLSSYKIKAYLYESLRPTPVLSFALRYLNCIAGINVTASHNPAEYNGYKVYWEDGAQIGPEQANAIAALIKSTDILNDVPASDAAIEEYIIPMPAEVDEKYIECVLGEIVYPEEIGKAADDLAIVYTPLHGAGIKMVPEVLKRAGLKNISIVEEQSVPNGDFPTVHFPNPEFPEAFAIGLEIAKKVGSSLVVATDPDADRVGVMAKNSAGEFKCITGNQMGALLMDYIITAYKESGTMPEEPYAVKSVVSSALAAEICKVNDVKMYDVLTGFKYIGEVIKNHEAEGHGTFLLGFEESYGYLKGTYARDKDAVVGTLLICEMAAYYFNRGMTLIDALDNLFNRYGCFYERTCNVYIDRPDGQEIMAGLMTNMRNNPPAEIEGKKIVEFRDYKTGVVLNKVDGTTSETGLPSADMLYNITEDGDVIIIRPSGTEPKIKAYVLLKAATMDEAIAYAEKIDAWFSREFNA